MFVGVGYRDDVIGSYKVGAYLYRTELPLHVGDHVITPTRKNPEQRGIVTCIDQPEPKFPCLEITQYDTEDANNG